MKVQIPASVEEAKTQLNGLGRLLTATEWEKAAIVAAFVEPGTKGGRQVKARNRFDATSFANLGIVGLRTHDTVLRYERAWRDAGMRKPQPGQTVELPGKQFPSEADGTGEATGGRPRTAKGEIKQALMEGNPRTLGEVAAAIKESPKLVDDLLEDKPTALAISKAAIRRQNKVEDAVKAETKKRAPGLIHKQTWNDVVGELIIARRALANGLELAKELKLSADEAAAFAQQLDEIEAVIDWFRSFLKSGNADFDTELQKMLEG